MNISDTKVQTIKAEWDDEGVYFYQAFNDEIADYAIEHQILGGQHFKPKRMTWIKPSFAWVLYRSGYGHKHFQSRILKIKLSHQTVAKLLSECECRHGGGGKYGRVQWDPARDIMVAEGKEPRKMQRERAIQIGLAGRLSELYVSNIVKIEDVTDLAHRVGEAHRSRQPLEMEKLIPELPDERSYIPHCSNTVLERLGLCPGETATRVSMIGLGKTKCN